MARKKVAKNNDDKKLKTAKLNTNINHRYHLVLQIPANLMSFEQLPPCEG